MSRLESFIRRLTAQRDILDQVCAEVAKIEGPVLELGLGNGRTFHHLRERLPGRRIVAFDRALAAHSSSIPEAENLVLGEIRERLLRVGGIAVSGTPLDHPQLQRLPPPPSVPADRYFISRRV